MRRRGLRSAKLQITNYKSQISQRGYMLITLMLALALITIGLLTVLPEIGQQIRRDREEEMRHRGTAYMRAIQHFYKKFGRYPSRVEELENTNNLRFIRKPYKDPINRDPATGKERDFKLLHQTDISLNNGPVLGQIPGQVLPGQGGRQGQGGLGGLGGMQGGLGGLQGLGGLGAQPGGLQQTGAGAQTPASGDSGNASSGNPSDAEGNSNSAESSPSNSIAKSGFISGINGPVFGGGPILGVASTSKAKSIRVFYEKNHYNDWLFIYVPMADRGGLLTGPVNPGMPAGNLNGTAPGQPVAGAPGQGLSPNAGQPQSLPTQPPQNPGQTPPE
jgi:type II secretory pathway pseudopilin PulG